MAGGRVKKKPEYMVWEAMKQRCFNPNNPSYARYGGAGISMFDEWAESSVKFLEYMGPRPSEKHSIDRIDNKKGYYPGNVQWATKAQQVRNTSANHNITIDGRTMCITDWAKEKGLKKSTVFTRIGAYGWDPIDAIMTPKVLAYER